MLRHAGAVTALAGAAFTIVPGLAMQGGASDRQEARVRALEHAVAERQRAIAALGQLATRVADGHSDALLEVRSVTEVPAGEARERDERLEALRLEVARLQLAWDGLRGLELGVPSAAEGAAAAPLGSALTVGLDAGELALLHPEEPGPLGRPRAGSTRPLSASASPIVTAVEAAPELSAAALALPAAERLRQARASHLAGQHERALALLDGLATTPDVLHARSRALERLGRLDEARGSLRLALADASLALPEHAALAERVRADLEYVEWTLALRDASSAASRKSAGGAR